MKTTLSLFLALTLLWTGTVLAEDWPGFRGPHGTGISDGEGALPLRWGPGENILWKVALPDPGNGSPIVSNGRVFLASADAEGRTRSLLCFDRGTGEKRWEAPVRFDRQMPTHKTNPHGSSTPAANGERVVVWHGSAGLHAYDFEGKILWSRDLGEFRHMWGYGSSPVIVGDRVILHTGPGKRPFVTAVSLETGESLWEVEEPYQGDGERNERNQYMGSWSTPVIVERGGRVLAVCSLSTRVNAYDVETGEILWTCEGLRGRKGDLAYTSPVVHGDLCVAMGGFGGPAIGFRMEGRGDITETGRLWREEPNPQRIGSGLVVDGRLYMANAGPATFQCIEPETGTILWEERSRGAAHWGSLVRAGGHLYVTDQAGTTHVLRPDPERLDIVASNRLGEPCNATPALSGDRIFIRTFRHLFCIGQN